MPYMPIFGTVIRYVTATFNSNGGTPTYSTARVRRNTTLNSPGTPTRSGFVFSGWSPSLPATILVNTTYTAQWTGGNPGTIWTSLVSATPNQTVTYNAYGGFCPDSSATRTWLTSSYPPSNYQKGHIMRVNVVDATIFPPAGNCAVYYYRAD